MLSKLKGLHFDQFNVNLQTVTIGLDILCNTLKSSVVRGVVLTQGAGIVLTQGFGRSDAGVGG